MSSVNINKTDPVIVLGVTAIIIALWAIGGAMW